MADTVEAVPSRLKRVMDLLSQIAIFVGAVAVAGVGNGNPYGFIVGLACQPFWFYTTWRHKQWGIFLASLIYTYGWASGVYHNFLK